MSKVEVDKGHDVFTEGDSGDNAHFVVVEGKVEVFMTVEHEESKKGESDGGSDVEVVTTLRRPRLRASGRASDLVIWR